MPTISVGRDALFRELGRAYTDEEFEELCFEFGIELDDVTSEKQMVRKELGLSEDADIDKDEEILYKIDVPANRYDLLCLEGIARALRIFLRQEQTPEFKVVAAGAVEETTMVVKPETALIRPFVVCAVLRGCTFNAESYASFIDLQDKLHQNLCRQRTLVAIGTHDLATLQGPFRYEALPPESISFVPLKQTEEFTAAALMEFYKSDQKLKQFLPILEGSPVFPVIYDSRGTVLSLPPIINGAHSAITLETRDVFIECTATDLTKARVVLNTVVTMFSQYCDRPFEVEPVRVVDQFKKETMCPDLSLKEFEVDSSQVCRAIGVDLGPEQIGELLTKMQLHVEAGEGSGGALKVKVPATRSDILHACDIYEDVAIAYGYNNIQKAVAPTATSGAEQPLNQLSDLVRMELAMAGFTEILTWALLSRKENFTNVRREAPSDLAAAVEVGNPKTLDFEVCRTSLLPPALKTLAANKDAPVPIKLFEVSDVVLIDDGAESGSRNERRVVALISAKDSGFEQIHGVLNRVMQVLGVPCYLEDASMDGKGGGVGAYSWQESKDDTFFEDRQAKIHFGGKEVGIFGILHPEVLKAFDIVYPCSALEVNLEPFCFDQFGQALV